MSNSATLAGIGAMRTFWLDMLTPKQVWLLESIKKRLETKGHKVLVTARLHDVVVDLLKLKGIPHYVVGKHGGETLEGKLRASAERVLALTDYLSPLHKEIDFSIHFSSPEAARVAFGLGIRSICLNDTPHSIAVGKLTFPLSTYVVTPACINPNKLVALGASKESLIQYDGVDEVAWIANLRPDIAVIKKLNLDQSKPIVIVRPEESEASYMQGLRDISVKSVKSFPLVRRVLSEFTDAQVIVMPRYGKQRSTILKEFGEKVIVPDQVIDGPSLLSFSTLTVSGGGTMSWESALLGVPTICYFPIKMDVERYLTAKGFPIYYTDDMDKATNHALRVLHDPDRYRVDTEPLVRKMESPVDAIEKVLKAELK
jgi:predicted glycosyltransferase